MTQGPAWALGPRHSILTVAQSPARSPNAARLPGPSRQPGELCTEPDLSPGAPSRARFPLRTHAACADMLGRAASYRLIQGSRPEGTLPSGFSGKAGLSWAENGLRDPRTRS